MATLPLATAFTDSAVTEGDFKTAITDQRTFLADLLGTDGTADTALRTLGSFGNDVNAKSSNYTVLTSDRGVVFNCTSTFTLSLTAAATLGDGFTFAVINSGSGTITIDPNSTEQIDGANTKTIEAGSWAIVNCTGSAFISMGAVPSTYTGAKTELFTSSGTWTVPDGVENATVVVIGGGGSVNSTTVGSSGGTSSFGAFISATGGSGGRQSPTLNGSSGTGTVSSGTSLKTGDISYLGFSIYCIGGSAYKPGTSTQNYSANSAECAGAGGSSSVQAGFGGLAIGYITGLSGSVSITVGTSPAGNSATGVGGAVLIMY